MVSDTLTNIAAFCAAHPTTHLVITDGNRDIFEGLFSPDQIKAALDRKESVIAIYCREAFFSLHFMKGQLEDCWRSPNGAWIGDELGLEGRNVFGNAPAPVRQPVEKRKTPIGLRTPVAVQPAEDELERAARTGDMAAALNGDE